MRAVAPVSHQHLFGTEMISNIAYAKSNVKRSNEIIGVLAKYGLAEWLGDGRLRTSQIRPAVRRHPVTGEELWFNHISFWHVSSLPDDIRTRFSADFGIHSLPYNTYHGDGTPISADVAAQLRVAYDAEMVSYPWQIGDFTILDNMLVAHGRATFTGNRRVLVSMGDPIEMPFDINQMAPHAGI